MPRPKRGEKRRRRRRPNLPEMDRIRLDRAVGINQGIRIEGPPLEALRFQGARRGGIVTVTDGEGRDFRGRVVRIGEAEAELFIFEAFPAPVESPVEIVLLQALPERERMELVIQKATELGVAAIIPFKSKRSISIEERESRQKKAHRWQEIAARAVRQSRRARVPRVEGYRPFEEALGACEGEGLKILLWEKDGRSLKEVLSECPARRVFIMVGPEGGFDGDEVARAGAAGFIPVKLGRRILRTETAAIALVAILQYELGDLG
jgi:16S rRNA (uracil1498-N3)-methyltransferase